MKKLLIVVALFSLFCVPAFAQDFPKAEIFGGYSILKSDTGLDQTEELSGSDFEIPGFSDATVSNLDAKNWQLQGFDTSFTYNATAVFGVEASFRYNRGDVLCMDVTVDDVTVPIEAKLKDIAFGVGPKFTFRNDSPVTPFGHVLIGFDNMKIDVSGSSDGQSISVEALSDTGLGVTLGGGLDVKVNDNFAIRIVQADYYMTRHMDETQNNFALSFGVVFGFGD